MILGVKIRCIKQSVEQLVEIIAVIGYIQEKEKENAL